MRVLTMMAVSGALVFSSILSSAAAMQSPREYVLELRTEVTAPMFVMPSYPGMPPGFGGSAPTRSISGDVTYRSAAIEPIFVTVPESLGLDSNRLVLHVSRMEDIPQIPQDHVLANRTHVQIDMTTRQFWHPLTAAGPLVDRIQMDRDISTSGGAPRVSSRMMERAAAEMDRTASGSDNVNRDGAVGHGSYILNTRGITMPLNGFLLPITVSQPASLMAVDLASPIEVVWDPDSQARGYILHGRGMIMDGSQVKEIIRWVSTESVPPERVRDGYEPATTIADDVRVRILLPPGTTRCVVPGGIFQNVDMLQLTVTAVGDDYLGSSDSCALRGRIRSVWTATRMKSMPGGMPGGYSGGHPGMNGYPGGVNPETDESEEE